MAGNSVLGYPALDGLQHCQALPKRRRGEAVLECCLWESLFCPKEVEVDAKIPDAICLDGEEEDCCQSGAAVEQASDSSQVPEVPGSASERSVLTQSLDYIMVEEDTEAENQEPWQGVCSAIPRTPDYGTTSLDREARVVTQAVDYIVVESDDENM